MIDVEDCELIEYWGSTEIYHYTRTVSDCCKADFTEELRDEED